MRINIQGHLECILRIITEAINVTVKVIFRYDVFMRFVHTVGFNAVQCLTIITISNIHDIASTNMELLPNYHNLAIDPFFLWTHRRNIYLH